MTIGDLCVLDAVCAFRVRLSFRGHGLAQVKEFGGPGVGRKVQGLQKCIFATTKCTLGECPGGPKGISVCFSCFSFTF